MEFIFYEVTYPEKRKPDPKIIKKEEEEIKN